MKSDWESKKSNEDFKNMESRANTTRKLSALCIFLGHGAVNGQLGIRILQEMEILASPLNETRLPYLDSTIPYNYKKSPIFELTWLFQYLGAALATVAYTGVYCSLVGILLHICGQFANLGNRIRNFGNETNPEKTNLDQLEYILRRHQYLIK